MRFESTITEDDLKTRFAGMRDVVTLSPYRIGDRIVRCGRCRAIIKTEFITGKTCPLCAAPFLPAPVERTQASVKGRRPRRERVTSICLLCLYLLLTGMWVPVHPVRVAIIIACAALIGIQVWEVKR